MVEWGVIGGVAIAALWIKGTHDRLIRLDERCRSARADVDTFLARRHDLIPGLVETVKGAAGHERGVLTAVCEAQAAALGAMGADKMKAEAQLTATINNVLQQAQRWPELRALPAFERFRADLIDAEEKIAGARRFFNLTVGEFNATLRQFPGSLLGRMSGLARQDPFDLGLDRVFASEPAVVRF